MDRTPHGTVMGHCTSPSANWSPSVAFYRDVIGFDVMMQIPSLVAVSAGGYHHHLNLNTWAGEQAPQDSDRVAGLSGWELRVPDEPARRALGERLKAAKALESTSNGVSARDPDAVAVQVVA